MALKIYGGNTITGTSNDTKPINFPNGTRFWELDTGFIFRLHNGSWTEVAYLRAESKATQNDAEGGTDNVKYMTALRVKQAIDKFAGESGEENTASNVGSGAEVFKEKVGVDLRFKTLGASGRLSIDDSDPDELEFLFDMTDILLGANNLDDLASASAARGNLGLGTAAQADTGVTEGDVPVLDSAGKLNESVLPALAISSVFSVANDTERDNLSPNTGDIAIVSDSAEADNEPATYIWDGNEWKKIKSPTDKVSSVFGRTGTITAQTGDYTWAQIDKSAADIADIPNRSHTHLQDVGTNTHAQIDSHIADDGKHREINDAGESATELWSSQKIAQEIEDAEVEPGGVDGSIQYNDDGSLEGSEDHTWNEAEGLLNLTGLLNLKEGGNVPGSISNDQAAIGIETETAGSDTIVTIFMQTSEGKVILFQFIDQ